MCKLDLMCKAGEGYGNDEIAENLGLASTTVRNRIVRIRSKLGLDSRNQLISYAARRGFLMGGERPPSSNVDV